VFVLLDPSRPWQVVQPPFSFATSHHEMLRGIRRLIDDERRVFAFLPIWTVPIPLSIFVALLNWRAIASIHVIRRGFVQALEVEGPYLRHIGLPGLPLIFALGLLAVNVLSLYTESRYEAFIGCSSMLLFFGVELLCGLWDAGTKSDEDLAEIRAQVADREYEKRLQDEDRQWEAECNRDHERAVKQHKARCLEAQERVQLHYYRHHALIHDRLSPSLFNDRMRLEMHDHMPLDELKRAANRLHHEITVFARQAECRQYYQAHRDAVGDDVTAAQVERHIEWFLSPARSAQQVDEATRKFCEMLDGVAARRCHFQGAPTIPTAIVEQIEREVREDFADEDYSEDDLRREVEYRSQRWHEKAQPNHSPSRTS
jgi:hypothetical protein